MGIGFERVVAFWEHSFNQLFSEIVSERITRTRMPQRINVNVHRLPGGCIAHRNLDGVILAAHRRHVGLESRASSKLNRTCSGEIGSARIKNAHVTKEWSAGIESEWISINLLVRHQFVGSRPQFTKTKFSIGPRHERARRGPAFPPFADVPAVQLQTHPRAAFRPRKGDVADNQRLRIEIDSDLRFSGVGTAIGWITRVLQKPRLARHEHSRAKVLHHTHLPGTQWPGVIRS